MSSKKEKEDRGKVGEKEKRNTKGASMKDMAQGPKAPSGPTSEDILGYPRRRSRFAKRGERANEAERAATNACGEKDDLRAPRLR